MGIKQKWIIPLIKRQTFNRKPKKSLIFTKEKSLPIFKKKREREREQRNTSGLLWNNGSWSHFKVLEKICLSLSHSLSLYDLLSGSLFSLWRVQNEKSLEWMKRLPFCIVKWGRAMPNGRIYFWIMTVRSVFNPTSVDGVWNF